MSDLANLQALADWMRKVGAIRVHVSKTVTEIELGQEPRPNIPPMQKSVDQILSEVRANEEQTERFLFAASEGFPDEVDPVEN